MLDPHTVPARPRPDRPFQVVSTPEGQDAGVHRPRRRPLPDADDAHAGDDRDLARRRACAAAERGSDRGGRARSRRGAPTVRSRRRSGARRLLETRYGRRFRHNEQSLRVVDQLERDGRGLNLTLEVRDGILKHTGPVDPDTLESEDRADRRPGRLHQPRHRRRRPCGHPGPERSCRGTRSPCSARPGRAGSTARPRPRRDVGGGGGHPAERRGRRGHARAAHVHVRARVPGARCTAEHEHAPAWSLRSSRTCSTTSTRCRTARASAERVTDYIAGMTDRFALAYAARLE